MAAIPYEPRLEYLPAPQPGNTSQFIPPDHLWIPAKFSGTLSSACPTAVWMDGVHGECFVNNNRVALFRIHRDGSVGIIRSLKESLVQGNICWSLVAVARLVNWHSYYVGQVWSKVGIVGVGELRIELQQLPLLDLFTGPTPWHTPVARKPEQPPEFGGNSHLLLFREILSGTLNDASERHDLVHTFAAKLAHAYGVVKAPADGFRMGPLYDRDGESTGFSLLDNGICFTRQGGNVLRLQLERDASLTQNGNICGWAYQGVVVDKNGAAIAAVEFARGPYLPSGFLVTKPDPSLSRSESSNPDWPPTPDIQKLPGPKRAWSELSLTDLLPEGGIGASEDR